jgi:hypothetical protein
LLLLYLFSKKVNPNPMGLPFIGIGISKAPLCGWRLKKTIGDQLLQLLPPM